MKRRKFIQHTGILGAGVLASKFSFATTPLSNFPVVRVAVAQRNFTSTSVENAIKTFKANVADQELGWLFENCFPNTLDTTVTYALKDGKPDTYVITGDIDAMWMRDSSAQVWPYLQFAAKEKKIRDLIAGVINRQTSYVLNDPYANAFYNDPTRQGEWKNDITEMKPGVHERKWEVDSLCYPIRLAYHYWKKTGDKTPFDAKWKESIELILQTFIVQQRKTGSGPYRYQRVTTRSTDTQPMDGYGFPIKAVGLICSTFRPSDDATIFPFLIPSNFFAVASLKEAAEMVTAIQNDAALAAKLTDLAIEVETALKQHAIKNHPVHGKIFAFEVDGFGNSYFMDDSNVPSLLSMPYLNAMDVNDPIYQNTRNFILSTDNPFFFKGKIAEGVGGPHAGADMIWPMAIILRAMTATNDEEIKQCIAMLKTTHAGKGFMHESFHKDDATKFTRSWFAWANTLFGELLWKIYTEKPYLLK